jgi:hypothetical protein
MSEAQPSTCVYLLLSSNLIPHNTAIKVNRTIILVVGSYECETWSLQLRKECRVGVLENRVLRVIFWLKTVEAAKG